MTAKEKVDAYSGNLEEYSGLLGLTPPAPHAARVSSYLALGPDDLDGLTSEELARISLDTSSFAARLQEAISREAVKVEKCRFEVARIVEGRLDDYSAFKTEDKRLAATLDDPVALEYLKVQRNCEAFVLRWSPHLVRLDLFVKAVGDFRYSKGK